MISGVWMILDGGLRYRNMLLCVSRQYISRIPTANVRTGCPVVLAALGQRWDSRGISRELKKVWRKI